MHNRVVLVQTEPRGPSQTIEIPVEANGQAKVPIPDINNLRSQGGKRVIIKGIRVVTTDVATNGIVTAAPNAPITELKKMFLTLYCEGWLKGLNIPLLFLNDVTVPGGTAAHTYQQTMFNNWEDVDLSQSYLQFGNGLVSAGAPYVVLLDIQYERVTTNGKEIIGPS